MVSPPRDLWVMWQTSQVGHVAVLVVVGRRLVVGCWLLVVGCWLLVVVVVVVAVVVTARSRHLVGLSQ